MANLITLHKRQVQLTDGTNAAYAKLNVYESETASQVQVYADSGLLSPRSQPIEADANGVFPVCYVAGAAALRLLVTDEDDVPLPGYPMDDITGEPTGASAASEISFTPSEDNPSTTVQAAIDAATALAVDNPDLVTVRLTPWPTSGADNAYTITPDPAITSYAVGQSWLIRPDRTNTASPTLNVNGIGASTLYKIGITGLAQTLAAGEIQQGREFMVAYDGVYFNMVLGRDLPFSGSGANGAWTKYPSGDLVCRVASFEVPYLSISSLSATWTFPAAFNSTSQLHVSATVTGLTPATSGSSLMAGVSVVTREKLSAMSVGPITTTTATIYIFNDGSANFAAGDKMYVTLRAEGRWS